MSDLILTDGREIDFDLEKMSLKEWRSLFSADNTPETEDKIIAKVAGLTVEEYQELSQPDWRKLLQAFFKKAREPLTDPS